MKLSNNTISILKNFSVINPNIYIRKGNKLRTISIAEDIAASATVEENFENDFAIYDLNTFLNGLKLYDNPELEFTTDDCVEIKQGKHRIKYRLTNPKLIKSAEDRDIKLPSKDVCFVLLQEEFEKLIKASSIFSLPNLSVIGDSEKIMLQITEKSNISSNEVSICVGETSEKFELNFQMEKLKIIPGNYDVVISNQLISEFTNKDFDISYYIGLDSDSRFYS
jgi:hypothetical protein